MDDPFVNSDDQSLSKTTDSKLDRDTMNNGYIVFDLFFTNRSQTMTIPSFRITHK